MKQQFLEFYQRMVSDLTTRYDNAETSTQAEAIMAEIKTYQKEVKAITAHLEKEALTNAQ